MREEIRKPTALEEVHNEVFDKKDGLIVRQDATEAKLEPIYRLHENLKWPARVIIGIVGLYLTAQGVKLLERLPSLFGAP